MSPKPHFRLHVIQYTDGGFVWYVAEYNSRWSHRKLFRYSGRSASRAAIESIR